VNRASFYRRTFWLVVMGAALAWPVVGGLRERRHEHRVRTLLLEVQRALQVYHVDQERYIPRQELKGAEIIAVLSDFGFLEDLPVNPWTRERWKLDGQEPDYLRYQTDPQFETYALRALDPRTGEVEFEIDRVENPSLE